MQRIGIAGAVSLDLLDFDFKGEVPTTLPFPMVSYITNEILNRGFKVTLFALGDKSEISILEDDRMKICIGRWGKHPGRNLFLKQILDLQSLMQAHSCDVMNVQWSYEFAVAALWAKIPSLITLRDHAPTILKYNPSYYRVLKSIMDYYVIRKGKHFTVNSEYLLNMFGEDLQKKARIIPNFYPNSLLHVEPPQKKRELYHLRFYRI